MRGDNAMTRQAGRDGSDGQPRPSLVMSGLRQPPPSPDQAQTDQAQRVAEQYLPGSANAPGMRIGNGSPLRWLFSSVWLVYLIEPVSALFSHKNGVLWIAGGLAITVAFCGIYVPLVGDAMGKARLARASLIAIVLLAALACVVYGEAWTSLWIYVSAAAGIVLPAHLPRNQTLLAILGVGVCYTFFSWLSHDDPSDYLVILLPVLLIGVAMVGFRMQIQLMRELSQARETVAKMAVNEERLRLARDMHDLTGQSLSMITLKSELASKRLTRLPPSPETEAIGNELGDISRVSRQTLHDIREAVSGYRRPTLAIELITARTALDAAGISLDDDPQLITRSGTFDPDGEAALAWCLREAVTNVVRHSGARNCVIRLTQDQEHGEISLRIDDDGRGFGGGSGGSGFDGGSPQSPGSGLRNMSERLSAVGGALFMSPVKPHGFRLSATVPGRADNVQA
jgi:two-component system sensor histidine kinase DesK